MERYTIEQRVKLIQAYYEKKHSNDFFGQFNRPNVPTNRNIVQKFEYTGSVGDVKTPVHGRTAEIFSAVRDSVAEEKSTSTRRSV